MFLNVDRTVQTNLIDPNAHIDLTPHEIDRRTYGSKTVLVVEQCMCAVQWGTKACLLLLYWRLTQNLTQGKVVKAVAAYCVVTYVIMEILYFAVWCRPFHDYWQTPSTDPQCTTALNHLIVNLVFNLTSDLIIMSIPLPLILRAHLDLKKKLLLAFPFSLGFFTISCAIASKHLSFTQPYSAEWVFWYCRESSTAMIVTNMPYSWALIRRIFKLRSFFGNSDQSINGAGEMRMVSGHSLGGMTAPEERKESQAITGSKSKFFTLPRSVAKKASGTSRILEEGRNQDSPDTLKEKDTSIGLGVSSSSNSSAGSPAQHAATSTSAAVDKLYCIDDYLERPEEDITHRVYDG